MTLAEKEGLALINGTDGMLGMLVLALPDLRALLTVADIAAAMSVEALLGTDRGVRRRPAGAAPAPRPGGAAANLRALLADSPIMASHRGPDCTRVQDAYSLRCAPQVHGAARDTLAHADAVAARELASAVDNPVVAADGRVESNGNFHGAPVAYVAGLPRHRRRRRRLDLRAAHRPDARRRPLARAAGRSSPTTPASTPAT